MHTWDSGRESHISDANYLNAADVIQTDPNVLTGPHP
jgi:hypothetical protein